MDKVRYRAATIDGSQMTHFLMSEITVDEISTSRWVEAYPTVSPNLMFDLKDYEEHLEQPEDDEGYIDDRNWDVVWSGDEQECFMSKDVDEELWLNHGIVDFI